MTMSIGVSVSWLNFTVSSAGLLKLNDNVMFILLKGSAEHLMEFSQQSTFYLKVGGSLKAHLSGHTKGSDIV